MTDYVDLVDAKNFLRGEGQRSTRDDLIETALLAAHRSVDSFCGRSFVKTIGADDAATTRTFRPATDGLCFVDDFWTTTSLVIAVDANGNGTANVTWAAADYELEPANGMVDGLAGFPFYKIVAVGSRGFGVQARRNVHVTAKWGWAAVPEPVKRATLQLTSTYYAMSDTPLGVVGMGEYGAVRTPRNVMGMVEQMLSPFRRVDRSVAFA
jgi:hypothetical protein